MSLNAAPGSDLCRQLLAVTERLSALVMEELRLLADRRMPPVGSNSAEEKERLARVYRVEVARIREHPHLVAGASSEERQRLRAACERLEGAVEAHAQALDAFVSLSEGLVKAIAAEIGSERAAPRGYGPMVRPNAVSAGVTGVAFNSKA